MLTQRTLGHGASYSRNEGAFQASGKYVCFLDDDDEWVDEHHLANAYETLFNSQNSNQIYITNQKAEAQDRTIVNNSIWTEDLICDAKDSVRILNVGEIMTSKGFTHMNCLILNKSLFTDVGGFDESIRYEEDRDFFMRLIASEPVIHFSNKFSSKHYIPEKKDGTNFSTSTSEKNKLLFQVYSNLKILSFTQNQSVISRCTEHLFYTQKKLAMIFSSEKNFVMSYLSAKHALAIKFSFKSWGFCVYLLLRKCLHD